mmetsp:Transcript_8127/g.24264  ORF Transcript_8127/g.24264 Transcript_8127/m.24264 type:complete len:204 (+) Transcript_8127:2374-2985(+)
MLRRHRHQHRGVGRPRQYHLDPLGQILLRGEILIGLFHLLVVLIVLPSIAAPSRVLHDSTEGILIHHPIRGTGSGAIPIPRVPPREGVRPRDEIDVESLEVRYHPVLGVEEVGGAGGDGLDLVVGRGRPGRLFLLLLFEGGLLDGGRDVEALVEGAAPFDVGIHGDRPGRAVAIDPPVLGDGTDEDGVLQRLPRRVRQSCALV